MCIWGLLHAMSLRGNVYVWLGCTKTWSPGIGTVLHWQPTDVHIFDTNPFLLIIQTSHAQTSSVQGSKPETP